MKVEFIVSKLKNNDGDFWIVTENGGIIQEKWKNVKCLRYNHNIKKYVIHFFAHSKFQPISNLFENPKEASKISKQKINKIIGKKS